MPGILPGAVAGFDAGLRANRDSAGLAIEQQRADTEADRAKYEKDRTSNMDKLGVLQSQAEDLGRQSRPLLAYLGTPPVDPKTDPDGYQKWLDSDDYKSHEAQAKDLHDKVTDVYGKRKAVQDNIIGGHIQATKDKVDENYARLQAGGSVQDLPGGEVADMFAVKAKTDPSVFLRDKDGHAPIDDINSTIQNSLHTGDWSSPAAAKAVTALVPQLHTAVGHPMAGGTVTGVNVSRVHALDGDPDNLHFTASYQVHMPDGSTKVVSGPPDQALPVPLSQLGQTATKLQQLGDLSKHPDLQAKIQSAFKDRTTSFHQLHDTLLAAGVPENELLPAPYTQKEIPAYGKLVSFDAQGRPVPGSEISGGTRPSTAASKEELSAQIASEHPDWPAEKVAQETALAWHPLQYRGGLVDQNSQRAPPGSGSGQAYSQSDRKEFEDSLKQNIASKYGAEMSDLDPKEDPLNRVPKDQQAKARQEFNGARIKMRNDMRQKKDVDPSEYIDKKPAGNTAMTHTYPNGVVLELRDGKWVRTK